MIPAKLGSVLAHKVLSSDVEVYLSSALGVSFRASGKNALLPAVGSEPDLCSAFCPLYPVSDTIGLSLLLN